MAQNSERILLKLKDKQSSHRRHKRHRLKHEFIRPSTPSDSSDVHAQQFRDWLSSLSANELENVFEVENPWISEILRKMHKRNLRDGDGMYTLNSEIKTEDGIDILDSYFTYNQNRFCFTEAVWNAKKFESILRFKDTNTYLDTLSISRQQLCDLPQFLQIVSEVSNKQAFKNPCRVSWDTNTKHWIWDYPHWFNPSIPNSLAHWALVLIEKKVWTQYFRNLQLDPRRAEETQNFTLASPKNPVKSSLNRQRILSYWSLLPQDKRQGIIGNLNEKFEQLNSQMEKQNPQCRFFLNGIMLPINYIISFEAQAQLFQLYNSRHYFYHNQNSVCELYEKALGNQVDDFIDFLLTWNLDKADTTLSHLCRTVAEQIMHAITEQIAEDLLINEAAPWKAQTKRSKASRKRKAKARRKLLFTSPIRDDETQASSQSDEDTEHVQSYVRQIVCQIFKDVFSTIQESEVVDCNSFKLVSPQKRKGRHARGNKTQPPHPKGKRQVPRSAKKQQPRNPNNSPQKKPQTPQSNKRYWRVDASQTQNQSKAKDDSEFPALISPTKPAISDLSEEIVDFYTSVTDAVNAKSEAMQGVYANICNICRKLFPPCYVTVYGSQTTGLALPNSDIDLVIYNSNVKSASSGIIALERELKLQDWVVSINGISTASVPVIKMMAKGNDTEFKIDMTFEQMISSANQGVESMNLTLELLQYYQCLPYLIITLKSLLNQHDLNSAYHGGLSSYSLVLWLVAYLNSIPNSSLLPYSDLLLGFLSFYSDLNPQQVYIDITNGGSYYQPRGQIDYVWTVDPVDASNNTTRSLYNFRTMQTVFKETYEKLKTRKHPLKDVIKMH